MNEYQVRKTKSSELRARLDHPIIDGDAHINESRFAFPDFLKQVGGPDIVGRFQTAYANGRPGGAKSLFWGAHSGARTIDRVTTMLPRLYARRLEEAASISPPSTAPSGSAARPCPMTRRAKPHAVRST